MGFQLAWVTFKIDKFSSDLIGFLPKLIKVALYVLITLKINYKNHYIYLFLKTVFKDLMLTLNHVQMSDNPFC